MDISYFINAFSIALAMLSLFLSVMFYRWGEKSNKETKEINSEMKSSIIKLETILNGLLKDNLELMRNQSNATHAWFLNNALSKNLNQTVSNNTSISGLEQGISKSPENEANEPNK